MKKKSLLLILCFLVLIFAFTACGKVQPSEVSFTEPTPVWNTTLEPVPPRHVIYPSESSGSEQVINDQVTAEFAPQKRAMEGDDFDQGRFERPFDGQMCYMGNIDIVRSAMVRTDPDFIYVTIEVAQPVASAINDPAYYGLELDLNRDGRSLFMIRGLGPLSETWMTEGVDVWKSTSAEQPAVMAEEGGIPVTGSLGFDVNLMRSGRGSDNDMAWMRLRPGTDNVVEIAFKNSIVGGKDGKFIWRPFTDAALYSEREYDLQVTYTMEQAGSPYIDEKSYPLKNVYAVDNTCRAASGYVPDGNEPDICPLSNPE